MPLNLALVAVVVCLAPLPLGSTKPFVLGAWCFLLALAASTMPLNNMDSRSWRLAAPVLALGGLWALLSLGHAWFAMASDAAVAERGLPVRDAAWDAAGLPLALMLVFLTCFAHARNPLAGGRLLRLLAVAGAGYAMLALLLHVFTPGQIFWYTKTQHREHLTGTFLNRNTAATFFGVVGMIWMARTFNFVERNLRPGQSLVAQLHWMPRPERNKLLRTIGCLLLCLAALFATGSRAGLMAVAAGAAVLTAVSLRRMSLRLARWQVGVIALSAMAGGAALLAAGGDAVMGRMSQQGLFDPLRYAVYRDTLQIIWDHPWFGTGPGTYEAVYPAYRSEDAAATGIVTRAHSTPLEFAATMGLPFALLCVIIFGWIIWRLGTAALTAPRGSSLLSAAFASAVVIAVHSLFDYSLQIPGFAFYAIALLSAGLARTLGRSGISSTPPH